MGRKLRELDLIITTLTSVCHMYGRSENIMLIYGMINGFNRRNIRDVPDYTFKQANQDYAVEHFHVPTTGEVRESDKLLMEFHSGALLTAQSNEQKFIKSFERVYKKHIEKYDKYKQNIGNESKIIFFIDYELLFYTKNCIEPLSPIASKEIRDIILNYKNKPDLIVFKSTWIDGTDTIWIHDINDIESFKNNNIRVIETQLAALGKRQSIKINRHKEKTIRVLCMFEAGFEPDKLFVGVQRLNNKTLLVVKNESGIVGTYDITNKDIHNSNIFIENSRKGTDYVISGKDKVPGMAIILSLDNKIFTGQQEINIRI